jgi:hypothetical protein
MRRTDLSELHYITHTANLGSILREGIVCHTRADGLMHISVAMEDIQRRRSVVKIPGGLWLHDYANLYINARNKMMSRVCHHSSHMELCVLRVSVDVLDLPGVIIADQNAASGYVYFDRSPSGLKRIDRDLVFAKSWKHPEDQIAEWRHGSVICAEVLVPNRIDPKFIMGAYVSCEETRSVAQALAPELEFDVEPEIFLL